MSQTGNGTLNMEDIELLRSGYTVCISRAPSDGLLFLHDDTRLPRFPGECNTRVGFYLLTVMIDAPSQLKGATVLRVVQPGTCRRKA